MLFGQLGRLDMSEQKKSSKKKIKLDTGSLLKWSFRTSVALVAAPFKLILWGLKKLSELAA